MLIKKAVGPSSCGFGGRIPPFVMEKGEGFVATMLIVRGNFFLTPGKNDLSECLKREQEDVG